MTDRNPRARIFVPARSHMQAGRARSVGWALEFEPGPARIDPLTGWAGSGDTQAQVRLRFETREAAVAYAEQHGYTYEVEEPPPVRSRPKSYAENFRFGRTENWTH